MRAVGITARERGEPNCRQTLEQAKKTAVKPSFLSIGQTLSVCAVFGTYVDH